MRRRKIWYNITLVTLIVLCSLGIGTMIKANDNSEIIIAFISLVVAVVALIISLMTFFSIDEVNAISRMDGNVMENPRYQPNILRAVFRFPQTDMAEASNRIMKYMENLFKNKNTNSGVHLADNVQEVADLMVLVPFFIHTTHQQTSAIHIERVSKLISTIKRKVKDFKDISDSSCKLLDETVSLIDAIFAYQNMKSEEDSGPSKLLEIRGSIFINPVLCILYNNYLGLYFLRLARDVMTKGARGLSLREEINCACGCNAEEKSKALVYCSKATNSFLQAKNYIDDDLIWNAFVCFNLSRAEYYKQLLNESFGDTSSNEWEAYINESIRSWMTSNKIIAEHFVSKKLENTTFFQQALISQENKVRVSKVVLQMMKQMPLTDYNGNPWVKQYNDITKTSFFKGIPEKDPQKQTDSLVRDIRELIKNNN